MNPNELWQRYQRLLCHVPGLGIKIDASRMAFDDGELGAMREPMDHAFDAMDKLEQGAMANPDEQRMVGHYWLRDATLAPNDELRHAITSTLSQIDAFAAEVHAGKIKPLEGKRFTDLLVVGIGGSALGPQLVADALSNVARRDRMRVHFLDNTDPDGFTRFASSIGARLKSTLVVVISKSGSTPETRNGMLAIEQLYRTKGLDFRGHAVAVTGEGSKLDDHARKQGWLARFPMWDWVGGRTSVMSAVGLLPMALQGLDIEAFLDGAAKMDACTRSRETMKNPAALLAMMWHFAGKGRGLKDMVVLPYKDRLLLFSRYLQQLVMESLGKELDLDGQSVHQGIAVYGNKGSTDQHAYVQQLRDGLDNFFATFIVVLRDAVGKSVEQVEVEHGAGGLPGVTPGDYLNGFWQGTRQALYEKGRGSITIMADKLDARTLGALIALYERAVGFYATLVNINAYHQPGVEAGKKAAATVLDLRSRLLAYLSRQNEAKTVDEIASGLGEPDRAETVHHLLEHLAANLKQVKRKGNRFGWKP
ncbi:MAG: glucose-6-phosphate isomerase [Phycisphaera sp.]|nr:glucose-6-phosphate isomerase [Phycisphaera sp.]